MNQREEKKRWLHEHHEGYLRAVYEQLGFPLEVYNEELKVRETKKKKKEKRGDDKKEEKK